MGDRTVATADVDGIPISWVEPAGAPVGTALWLTHLGGSAEQTHPMLARLAGRGLLAVSFDPPQHGTRGPGSTREYADEVLASFRRRMWPLLGRFTLESLRVLDWADDRFEVAGPHVAGGVSMGGDVAVALAGIDQRISRVCAVAASPDWTRPGMSTLEEPTRVLGQGTADRYAQWFYDQLDPMTHLDRYLRPLAISFQSGGADRHVPVEAAARFRAALIDKQPDAARRIRIDVHTGLSHLDVARADAPYANAESWVTPSPEGNPVTQGSGRGRPQPG